MKEAKKKKKEREHTVCPDLCKLLENASKLAVTKRLWVAWGWQEAGGDQRKGLPRSRKKFEEVMDVLTILTMVMV